MIDFKPTNGAYQHINMIKVKIKKICNKYKQNIDRILGT